MWFLQWPAPSNVMYKLHWSRTSFCSQQPYFLDSSLWTLCSLRPLEIMFMCAKEVWRQATPDCSLLRLSLFPCRRCLRFTFSQNGHRGVSYQVWGPDSGESEKAVPTASAYTRAFIKTTPGTFSWSRIVPLQPPSCKGIRKHDHNFFNLSTLLSN